MRRPKLDGAEPPLKRARKNVDEKRNFCLKSYLWTIVDDVEARNRLRDLSVCASQLYFRAGILSNLFFQRVDIGDIDDQFLKDTINNVTFWKKLLLPEKWNADDRHHLLNALLADHNDILTPLLPQDWERKPKTDVGVLSRSGWDNVLTYLAESLKTNATLHIRLHIAKRVKSKIRSSCSHKDCTKALYHPCVLDTLPSHERDIVSTLRQRIDASWIDDPKLTASILKLHIELSRQLDGKDAFRVMPKCKYRRVYVRVCTRVLHHLCGVDNIEEFLNLDPIAWRKRRQEVRRIVRRHNIGKKGSKKRHGIGKLPAGRVSSFSTDGVGLSMTFECEKRSSELIYPTKCNIEDSVLIGVDPGRCNLVTSVEARGGDISEITKCLSISRKEFYGRCLIKRNRKWVAHRPDDVRCMNDESSDGGGWRNSNTQTWLAMIDTTVRNIDARRLEYIESDEYSKWQMVLWRRKRSFINNRINGILQTARLHKKYVVVGYGASNIKPTGKGEQAVPTTGVVRAFRRVMQQMRKEAVGRIEFIDEYCTTKCCHKCGQLMGVLKKTIDGRLKEVRGIRLCHTCGIKNKPLRRNRDVNAARNILNALVALLRGQPRPTHLCRPKKECSDRSSPHPGAVGGS